MRTTIINPGWILEVTKHAGNETPEAFDVIIHKRNAFCAASASDLSKCAIETDFSDNPLLHHLTMPAADDPANYVISRSQLQSYHLPVSPVRSLYKHRNLQTDTNSRILIFLHV